MTTANPQAPEDWACDWDAQERRKYTIGLDATPAQRLDWLEEMIELAHASGALPRPRDEGGRSGTRRLPGAAELNDEAVEWAGSLHSAAHSQLIVARSAASQTANGGT